MVAPDVDPAEQIAWYRRRVEQLEEELRLAQQRSATSTTALTVNVRKLNNETLVVLAASGDIRAIEESLRRHIAEVDGVTYREATEIFAEIEHFCNRTAYLLKIPFQAGVAVCGISILGSIPFVFDLRTVSWFNLNYVTFDTPPATELATPLEVGTSALLYENALFRNIF